MFKLMKVYPRHDSPYAGGYVKFDKRYNVGEFMEVALEKHPAVSGTFAIDGTSLEVQYCKGKLSGQQLPERILNARIAAVSFCSGWNTINYVITKLEGQ